MKFHNTCVCVGLDDVKIHSRVLIRSETKHALLTGVLSDVDELYQEHEKYSAKACYALQIGRIEHISTRSEYETQ